MPDSEKVQIPVEDSVKMLPMEQNAFDAIGLSLEQVRGLLAEKHGTVVDKADPILMVVTILNAHLTEVEKLQARHRTGLGKLMSEKTDAYVSGVQEAVAQLAEKLSSASVEGMRITFAEHTARLQLFQSSLIWLAAIVATSALLNVVVFVLRGLR